MNQADAAALLAATRDEAMEAGCIAYLQKPLLAHLLIGAIEKAAG